MCLPNFSLMFLINIFHINSVYLIFLPVTAAVSGVATVSMGGGAEMPLPFCQDGARDFFKIDEKITGEWPSSKSS